jgi:hypothetical protein
LDRHQVNPMKFQPVRKLAFASGSPSRRYNANARVTFLGAFKLAFKELALFAHSAFSSGPI